MRSISVPSTRIGCCRNGSACATSPAQPFGNLFSLRLWRGEVTDAKACAQRYLEIDPYCERMHAALMRLHLSQGERARAAGRYGQLRTRLARDLHIRPSAEVEQLARVVSQTGSQTAPGAFNAAWVLGRNDGLSDSKPLVAVLPFRISAAQCLTCSWSSRHSQPRPRQSSSTT